MEKYSVFVGNNIVKRMILSQSEYYCYDRAYYSSKELFIITGSTIV